MLRLLCAVLALLCLSVAPAYPAERDAVRVTPPLYIKGILSYRPRIALAPDSVAVIEVREVSEAGDGRVAAETRIALKGTQVPIAFEVAVNRARLEAGKRYAVRGGILSDGRPVWASEAAIIDPRAPALDVGVLNMTQVRVRTFASVYECGDLRATVEYPGGAMRLTVGLQPFEMKRVDAATGARYEAVNDPGTSFWTEGDGALLVLRGKTYPECRRSR